LEVDITRDSMDKFPLFAAVGIPEVWRYDGTDVRFYSLGDGAYSEAPESAFLAPLTAEAATSLLRLRQREPMQGAWRKAVRQWFDHAATAQTLSARE
jgi:Uma2 family endonuclease